MDLSKLPQIEATAFEQGSGTTFSISTIFVRNPTPLSDGRMLFTYRLEGVRKETDARFGLLHETYNFDVRDEIRRLLLEAC